MPSEKKKLLNISRVQDLSSAHAHGLVSEEKPSAIATHEYNSKSEKIICNREFWWPSCIFYHCHSIFKMKVLSTGHRSVGSEYSRIIGLSARLSDRALSAYIRPKQVFMGM